jgi:hypothetical protein
MNDPKTCIFDRPTGCIRPRDQPCLCRPEAGTRRMLEDAVRDLTLAQKAIDQAILCTPTSALRNVLCEANINTLEAISLLQDKARSLL